MASSSGPPARGWAIETGLLFTEAELAAADHLVQLSSSSGRDDEASSPTSSSSSPRSVNTGAAAPWKMEREEVTLAGPAGDELDRRARKRYRLLSDLYAATGLATGACLGAAVITSTSSARKRKRYGEQDGKAARYGDQSF